MIRQSGVTFKSSVDGWGQGFPVRQEVGSENAVSLVETDNERTGRNERDSSRLFF